MNKSIIKVFLVCLVFVVFVYNYVISNKLSITLTDKKFLFETESHYKLKTFKGLIYIDETEVNGYIYDDDIFVSLSDLENNGFNIIFYPAYKEILIERDYDENLKNNNYNMYNQENVKVNLIIGDNAFKVPIMTIQNKEGIYVKLKDLQAFGKIYENDNIYTLNLY